MLKVPKAVKILLMALMKRTSLRVPRKLGANSTNTVHDAAGIMAPAQVPPTENSAVVAPTPMFMLTVLLLVTVTVWGPLMVLMV